MAAAHTDLRNIGSVLASGVLHDYRDEPATLLRKGTLNNSPKADPKWGPMLPWEFLTNRLLVKPVLDNLFDNAKPIPLNEPSKTAYRKTHSLTTDAHRVRGKPRPKLPPAVGHVAQARTKML